jgi:hypothetical protein
MLAERLQSLVALPARVFHDERSGLAPWRVIACGSSLTREVGIESRIDDDRLSLGSRLELCRLVDGDRQPPLCDIWSMQTVTARISAAS